MRFIIEPKDRLVITSELDAEERADTKWEGEVRMAGIHVAWADYSFDNLQPGGRRRVTIRLRPTEGTTFAVE